MATMSANIRINNDERLRIREIITQLQSTGKDPFRIPIIGVLKSSLINVLNIYIELDRWPDFTTILVKQNQPLLVEGDDKQPDLYNCYSTSPSNLDKFLQRTSLLNWKMTFEIISFDIKHLDVFTKYAISNGLLMSLDKPHHIAAEKPGYVPSTNHLKNLPPGYTVGSLRSHDIPLVNSCWDYGGTKSTEALISLEITYLPTVCIFNEKNDPVSWVLMRLDGMAGIGHTLQEYRGLGLYHITMAEQTRRRNQQRLPVYGYIYEGNTGAEKACVAAGQKLWREVVQFATFTPKPKANL